MPKLKLLVTDPEWRNIERPGLVWGLWGVAEADLRLLEERGGADDGLEAEILSRSRDASIVKLHCERDRPAALAAWKGVFSDHQIFWSARPDGDLVLADHFRNAFAVLPVAERIPCDAALVDHFLYRQVLGEKTYGERVRRLGHGGHVHIDIATGTAKTSVFDRIEDVAEPRATGEHVAEIDRALASVLEPLRRESGVANQFSGGVDSTLLQTYLVPEVPAVNLVPDSPEFGREIEYASHAAALLGVRLERHPIREADYFHQVEQTIDHMGLPPIHEGTILDHEVYRLDFRKFVVGEHGDTVFGMGGRRARIARAFASAPGSLLLGVARALAPEAIRERVEAVAEVAAALRQPPEDPAGHPARGNLHTDLALAEAIFGAARVRERMSADLDYVFARVVPSAPASKPFLRNLEMARWVGAFDDVLLPQRHLAQARGKSVVSPFAAPAVLASALAVPIERRYLRGLQDKYLLKLLLKKRLPGYPVKQRKRSTELPVDRYYREGPLARVWDRYRFPDFIEGPARERIRSGAGCMTWNALTWAIWEERIARNPALRVIPTTRTLSWDL